MISVVVPVYNKEKTIERCIKSISSQSYSDLEIIIVDDGSADKSGCICEKLSEHDNRIRIIRTENAGAVAARKKGIAIAKGDYIGFVDADDLIEPDMYERLFDAIRKSNADFVHSGFVLCKDDYSQPVIDFGEGFYKFDSDEARFEFLKHYYLQIKEGGTISYSLWSKLYKKKFIEKEFNHIQDGQDLGEDAVCLCRCILDANSVYLLPIASYHYYVYENSLSRVKYERVITENVHRCSEIISLIESYGFGEVLRSDIADFSVSFLLKQIKGYSDYSHIISRFYCGFIESLVGKRVVLYGAGEVGRCYYKQLNGVQEITVVGICDSYSEKRIDNLITKRIEEVRKDEYDTIVISVDSESASNSIQEYIRSLGIHDKEVLWFKPKRYY